jgi:hypothetical protein
MGAGSPSRAMWSWSLVRRPRCQPAMHSIAVVDALPHPVVRDAAVECGGLTVSPLARACATLLVKRSKCFWVGHWRTLLCRQLSHRGCTQAVTASEIGSCRLIVGDAMDDEAQSFYKHYDFDPRQTAGAAWSRRSPQRSRHSVSAAGVTPFIGPAFAATCTDLCAKRSMRTGGGIPLPHGMIHRERGACLWSTSRTFWSS